MDKFNSFFEDLPSLHDISNRVTEGLARFSVRNDEEALDHEKSIIDLIEHANTSTRGQFSHNVASPSASETKSESPSHHEQKSPPNDTVIPVPLPEHIPPTMNNRVSIQKQTPPSRETANTTPPTERIPKAILATTLQDFPYLHLHQQLDRQPCLHRYPHLRYPMQENQLDIHLPHQEETTTQIPTITLQCQPRLANQPRNPLLSLLYLQSNKIHPKTSIHTAKCRKRSYACNSMHYNRNNAL